MEESNGKDMEKKISSSPVKDDKFPEGLRVLAVDDNIVCLMFLERLLRSCRYNVTLSREADSTIDLLKEKKDEFDIVITDVHMTNKRDGFKLLETIGLEMDIPVVMVSADDDKDLVLKAIEHGACDYLVKPLRLTEIKNIWQHVIRKTKSDGNKSNCSKTKELRNIPRTTTNAVKREREEVTKDDINFEEVIASKRPRFSWTAERHAKFIAIVSELGADNAAPSKILEKMGIPGLTRQQVASHLQKFRSGIKKTRSKMSIGSMDQELVGNPHITINNQGVLQVGQQVHRPRYINQLNNIVHVIPQTIHTLNHYNQAPMFRGDIPSSMHPELYNLRASRSLLNNHPSIGSMSPNTYHSRDLDFLDSSCRELIPNHVSIDMELVPQTNSFHVNEIFSEEANRSCGGQFDIPSFEETLIASTNGHDNYTMEQQHLDLEYLFQQSDMTSPNDEDDINGIINSTLQGMR